MHTAPDRHLGRQHQDTARVLLHTMRRMDDEVFKKQGGKILYLLDSDIVALYANPRNNLKYTDALMPTSEDAEALSWAITEYIFTTQRLGQTVMALPHRYEALRMLRTVLRKTQDTPPVQPTEQITKFLETIGDVNTDSGRKLYGDATAIKMLQQLYGYVSGASENFQARRFLTALRNGWIESVDEAIHEKLPAGIWPDDEQITSAADIWFETVRNTRKLFHQSNSVSDDEQEAVNAHAVLTKNNIESAKTLRDYADAQVLASLEEANRRLGHQSISIRLVLVTGSPTLHLAAELYGRNRNGDESTFGTKYLRHPLMLLAAPNLLPDIVESSQDLGMFLENALQQQTKFSPQEKSRMLCEECFGSNIPSDIAEDLALSSSAIESLSTHNKIEDELRGKMQGNWVRAIRVSAFKGGMLSCDIAYKRAIDEFCLMPDMSARYERFKELVKNEARKTTNEFIATLLDLGLERFLKPPKPRTTNITQVDLEHRRGTPYIDFGIFKHAKNFYKLLSDATNPRVLTSERLGALRQQMLDGDHSRYTMVLVYGLVFAQFGSWDLCERCAEFALDIAKGLPSETSGRSELRNIHGEEAAYLLAYALRHQAKNCQVLDRAKTALNEAIAHNGADPRFKSERLALEVSRWSIIRYEGAMEAECKPSSLYDLQSRFLEELETLPPHNSCTTLLSENDKWCRLEEQLLTNLFIVTLMRELPAPKSKKMKLDSDAVAVFSKYRGLKFYLDLYCHMLECRKTQRSRVSALVEAVFFTASAAYDKEIAGWSRREKYDENRNKLERWRKDDLGLLERDKKRIREYLAYIDRNVPQPAK